MITVLLVEDHIAVRDAYQLLLAQYNIKVTSEVDNGEKVLSNYDRFKPDIVLMDLSIKGMNGLDCTTRLLQHHPNAKVIIFSMHDHVNFVTRAIQNGAMGYVLKSDPSSVLIEAIKQVYYQSKRYLSNSIAHLIAMKVAQPSEDMIAQLSPREHSIFLLLIEGKSRSDIARTLSLSVSTVSNNKTKIMQKLGVKTMTDLFSFAVEQNTLKVNQL